MRVEPSSRDELYQPFAETPPTIEDELLSGSTLGELEHPLIGLDASHPALIVGFRGRIERRSCDRRS